MSEPKYYDELPTYIMHSDGEFKEGVFKAVDGSGNSLTIGTEKSDTGVNLTIEGVEKAEFSATFEKREQSTVTSKVGSFVATIGEILFQIAGSAITASGEAIEALSVAFKKGDETISFSLPSLGTLDQLVQAISAQVERLMPKNIKDGTGTGGVISGVVRGENACVASGENSFAGGEKSKAINKGSFTYGKHTSAKGDYSASFNYSDASGEYSFSANTSTADGNNSFSANQGNAKGEDSFACNRGYSKGEGSFCAGLGTAEGKFSAVFGLNTAKGYSQFVIGENCAQQGTPASKVSTDYAFIIGNGADGSHPSNALAVRWDGAIVLANGTVLTVEQLAKVANLT